MYSLSTCWNSGRHTDGRAMLQEIRDLGFTYAELSHGIRISLLPGVFEAVQAGEIRISSLHNFCPLPIGVTHASPNVFKFSSPDRRERENAMRHTLKTFDTAQRVEAPFVVLHLGEIEMQSIFRRRSSTSRLTEMIENGQRESPAYERLVRDVSERRERRKGPHLEWVYEALHRLADEAQKAGIRLGIENREAVEEIPLESDFPLLFKEFRHPALGYWHDTGHAQIKQNLGFIDHAMHLESLADSLLGLHVHDVQFPGGDHCPPGAGTIDFRALQPSVKPSHPKILELSPQVPVEDLQAGLAHIQSIWGKE